jgi:hypothetical protein
VTKSRLCFQLRLSEQAKVLSYGIVLRAHFVTDGGFGQSTRASISVPSTRTLQKRRTQIDMRERACRREKSDPNQSLRMCHLHMTSSNFRLQFVQRACRFSQSALKELRAESPITKGGWGST